MSNFEIITCGRCGGSGKHSYNQMDGDRCYGCGGSGKKFSGRGKKAHDLYMELVSVKASDLKDGDQIKLDLHTRVIKQVKVTNVRGGEINCWSIEKDADGNEVRIPVLNIDFDITYSNGKVETHSLGINTAVRKYFPKSENDAFVTQALELQNSLTPEGKKMKVNA